MLARLSVVLTAAVAVALLLAPDPASGSTTIYSTSFEASGDEWGALDPAESSIVAGGVGGSNAMRATVPAAAAGAFHLVGPETATVAGAVHSAEIWVLSNSTRVFSTTLKLQFFSASDVELPGTITALTGQSSAYRKLASGDVTAPPLTATVRLSISIDVPGAGAQAAQVLFDNVSIVRGDPPPTPTATPTATATPTPTATASATATSTGTAIPTATSTAASTAVATPTPTVVPVITGYNVNLRLINGGFESGLLDGWSSNGGTVTITRPGLGGTAHAMQLASNTDSTKFLFQTVSVQSDAWFRTSAIVQLHGPGAVAWLRIAWYADVNADGAQHSTVDSPLVSAATGGEQRLSLVARAPEGALTARVRLMLRPLDEAPAALVADAVTFEATSAPAATPTAAATARATVTATPTVPPTTVPRPAAATTPSPAGALPTPPAAAVGAGTSSMPGAPTPARELTAATPTRPAASATVEARGDAAPSSGTASLLRISELLPDPVEAGADAEFEWIEIANLGATAVPLGGVFLADNQGALALPPLTLAPGRVLLIAGARAAVPDDVAWRPVEGFSNGLGNGGDRLALYTTQALLDALSYGSDSTYDRPPLPAPGAGKSLARRFADDGSVAAVEGGTPTPGMLFPQAAEAPVEASLTPAGEEDADWYAWAALASFGLGALGVAAGQRLNALRLPRTRPPER